jgi:hypothetical protein
VTTVAAPEHLRVSTFMLTIARAFPGDLFIAYGNCEGAFSTLADLERSAIEVARYAAAHIRTTYGPDWVGTVAIADRRPLRNPEKDKPHPTVTLAIGVRHLRTHVKHTEYRWPEPPPPVFPF